MLGKAQDTRYLCIAMMVKQPYVMSLLRFCFLLITSALDFCHKVLVKASGVIY